MQLYNEKNIARNLEKLQQSVPDGSKLIGRSGHIANSAHASGFPFIIPTDRVADWSAIFPNTSISQSAQPYWGGMVNLTIDEIGDGSAFVYEFDQPLDLREFQNGSLAFYFQADSNVVAGGSQIEFSFVSDFDLETFRLGFYRYEFDLPDGYVAGDIFRAVINIQDFYAANQNNGTMDASNILGVALSFGGSSTGVLGVSGISLYANPIGETNVTPNVSA